MSENIIKELESLGRENGDHFFYVPDYEELNLVREGDWVEDGKYSICETIFAYKNKLFSVVQSRTGSYHTDYYYNEPDFYEVEPKVVTETIYVKVK